jgi:hypothetical protein
MNDYRLKQAHMNKLGNNKQLSVEGNHESVFTLRITATSEPYETHLPT